MADEPKKTEVHVRTQAAGARIKYTAADKKLVDQMVGQHGGKIGGITDKSVFFSFPSEAEATRFHERLNEMGGNLRADRPQASPAEINAAHLRNMAAKAKPGTGLGSIDKVTIPQRATPLIPQRTPQMIDPPQRESLPPTGALSPNDAARAAKRAAKGQRALEVSQRQARSAARLLEAQNNHLHGTQNAANEAAIQANKAATRRTPEQLKAKLERHEHGEMVENDREDKLYRKAQSAETKAHNAKIAGEDPSEHQALAERFEKLAGEAGRRAEGHGKAVEAIHKLMKGAGGKLSLGAMFAAPLAAGALAYDSARSQAEASDGTGAPAASPIAAAAKATAATGVLTGAIAAGIALATKAAPVAKFALGKLAWPLAVGLAAHEGHEGFKAQGPLGGLKGAADSLTGGVSTAVAKLAARAGTNAALGFHQGGITGAVKAVGEGSFNRTFDQANAAFHDAHLTGHPEPGNDGQPQPHKGWSNAARIKSAEARHVTLPYGGNPTGPGKEPND